MNTVLPKIKDKLRLVASTIIVYTLNFLVKLLVVPFACFIGVVLLLSWFFERLAYGDWKRNEDGDRGEILARYLASRQK